MAVTFIVQESWPNACDTHRCKLFASAVLRLHGRKSRISPILPLLAFSIDVEGSSISPSPIDRESPFMKPRMSFDQTDKNGKFPRRKARRGHRISS